jgi:hypothetical protein
MNVKKKKSGEDTSLECKNWTLAESLLKPEGTRHVEKPRLKWFVSDEEDLKNMGVRNWRGKQQNRVQWRTVWKRLRFITDCNARRRRILL